MLNPSRHLELHRRDLLKATTAGVGVAAASGWMSVLAQAAAEAKPAKQKSVILLWMDGGPSHKDTFDLKPGSTGAGDFQPIKTSAPGVEISEHLPNVAKWMHAGCLVRGMTSPEGAHSRAKYNLHTGYREGAGGVTYPSIGAVVGHELGTTESAVPNFVSIGARSYGSGYLGPKYQPLLISDATRGLDDLKLPVPESRFAGRLDLLDSMEKAFYHEYKAGSAQAHSTAYDRAVTLMRSPQAKAFDVSLEPAKSRAAYGTGKFADGVLMARRLVEVGVPFVEVSLGGWDTHLDNFTKVKTLSGTFDTPLAALLADLKQRGMLDTTLVVWMGEFGRTPNINTRGDKPGRDHYPKAWSLAMFGGGLRGGSVVGKTDAQGATVVERPVTPADFLGTVCELVGIDHTKKFETATGRPIQIVEKATTFTKDVV